MKTDQKLEDR